MLKLRQVASPNSAIWLVEPRVIIGSESGCNLVLRGAEIAPQQLEIDVEHENLKLTQLAPGAEVTVNGSLLNPGAEVDLRVGDLLCVGEIELEVVDPKRISESRARFSPVAERDAGWALKANHSALANRIYPVSGTTLVGRSSECDIVLAAAHLSRRHAQLSLRNGALFVKDLGSVNGTFLNGERVAEARLKRGDELRFDTLSFGVLGPSEDMDKTTIRKVSDTLEPPPQRTHAKGSEPSGSVVPEPGAGMVEASAEGAPDNSSGPTASASPAEPVTARSGAYTRRILLGCGVLLLAAAGILVSMR